MNVSECITAFHLGREAIIYIRQSSPHQTLTNQESLKLQYALRQRAIACQGPRDHLAKTLVSLGERSSHAVKVDRPDQVALHTVGPRCRDGHAQRAAETSQTLRQGSRQGPGRPDAAPALQNLAGQLPAQGDVDLLLLRVHHPGLRFLVQAEVSRHVRLGLAGNGFQGQADQPPVVGGVHRPAQEGDHRGELVRTQEGARRGRRRRTPLPFEDGTEPGIADEDLVAVQQLDLAEDRFDLDPVPLTGFPTGLRNHRPPSEWIRACQRDACASWSTMVLLAWRPSVATCSSFKAQWRGEPLPCSTVI